MSRYWRRLGIAVATLGLLGATPAHQSSGTITVFAAASLTEAFTDVDLAFRQQNPGTTVRFNFAGSQQLAAQLEQGAQADVFASADERWMTYAREQSLIRGDPAIFARTRLIVIVPKSNPARINQLQDLAKGRVKLVLAGAAVPAGKYARDILQNLSRTSGYPADFQRRVLANVVSNEETVKGVVTKVQLGEADAGVVYRTDVNSDIARVVRVFEIPEDQNVLASYLIATVRGTQNPETGRAFVTFVISPEGQRIMQQHGFLPLAVP
ncbi:MAG: molybdate ABC transporter substrate-binding protein [Gemmatimonadota bacterium]